VNLVNLQRGRIANDLLPSVDPFVDDRNFQTGLPDESALGRNKIATEPAVVSSSISVFDSATVENLRHN
jgi:hypothetical protein